MSHFNIEHAREILERTPSVLNALLSGVSEAWLHDKDAPESWSPCDILGHLIHGEKTDWIPRTKIILESGKDTPFEPFDRYAQFSTSQETSITELLTEFTTLRHQNLAALHHMHLTEEAFQQQGMHPELGIVTLRQLLAAWVVHDLGHLRQIARVMAKRYADDIGPWKAYLPVVTE